MANQGWSFLKNPFDRATQTSYIRAAIIGTYTDATLGANPALASLYNALHPAVEAYNSLYAQWRNQAGSQKGKTLGLAQLLAESTDRLNDWEYRVMGTFRKTTPQYKAIFPNGHAPFQKGSQQSRMEAFEALSLALKDANLDELSTEVKEYFLILKAANESQKGAIGQTSQLSENLEAARLTLCEKLYATLGGLMQHFAATPESVASYFKLSLIQKREQKSFTGHLEGGEMHLVAKRTLAADNEISLLNGGAERLVFFLSDRADAPPVPGGGVGVWVDSGMEQTVPASRLGAVATAHYLYVYNPSNATGDWEVDL